MVNEANKKKGGEDQEDYFPLFDNTIFKAQRKKKR